MDIVILVRIVVWLTFLLLIAEGIAAVILARHAVRIYVRRHRELEVRLEFIERRLKITEE